MPPKTSTQIRLAKKLGKNNIANAIKSLERENLNDTQYDVISSNIKFLTDHIDDIKHPNQHIKDPLRIINNLKHYDNLLISSIRCADENKVTEYNNLYQLHSTLFTLLSRNNQSSNALTEREEGMLMHELYKNGSFIVLYFMHHSCCSESTPENFPKALIMKSSHELSSEAFRNIIQFYNINIEWESTENNLKMYATYLERKTEITDIHGIIYGISSVWQSHHQKAKDMLQFFVSQGLDLNNKNGNYNAIAIAIKYNTPTDFIEKIINLGANPNMCLLNKDQEQIKIFDLVIFNGSLELVELFLNHIDIVLYIQNSIKFINYMYSIRVLEEEDYNVREFMSCLAPLNQDGELASYFEQVFALIEEHFLEYCNRTRYNQTIIEPSLIELDNDTIHKSNGSAAQYKKKKKAQKKHDTKICKTINNDDSLKDDAKVSGANITKQDSKNLTDNTENLIKNYIALKNTFVQSGEGCISEFETLKHEFDILLLGNKVDELRNLLDKKPELYSYSVTALLHNDSSNETVYNILANHNYVHQFFALKKGMISSSKEKANDNITKLAQNVYEAESLFDGRIFFALTESVFSKLELDNDNKLQKIKIISAGSEGINGIKFYKNAVKLKLNNNDKAAYTKAQYIYEKDIFLLFDRWENHAWQERQVGKLSIIYAKENDWNALFQGDFGDQKMSDDYYHDENIHDEEVTLTGQDEGI